MRRKQFIIETKIVCITPRHGNAVCMILSLGKYLDLFDERVKQMYSIAVYYMTANGGAVAVVAF